jgi:hypothetical protein
MRKDEITDSMIPPGKFNSIYRGVVENNDDPLKAGRCQIRIFGIHSELTYHRETQGVPLEHLPWAEPAAPIWGGCSGIGFNGVPVQGAHVFLFFEAGDITQPRYFATAPGFPYSAGKPASASTLGFTDPEGIYPLAKSVNMPDSTTGNGPSDYRKIFAIVGHCGHQIILDSTDLHENIKIINGKSGASIELDVDGNVNIHCKPDATTNETAGERFVISTKNHTVNVTGDYSIVSKNSKENVNGSKNTTIAGALAETVVQNWNIKATGIEIHSNGDTLAAASGEATFTAGKDCKVTSSDQKVIVDSLKSNVELNAKIAILQGRALMIDMEATTTAKFTGKLTNIGGTSMLTTIGGQLIMIG